MSEPVDFEQASRVAHAIALGAEGLPPRDYDRLARAYLRLLPTGAAGEQAPAREPVAYIVCEHCGTTYERPFHQCPVRFPAGVPEVSPAPATVTINGGTPTPEAGTVTEAMVAGILRDEMEIAGLPDDVLLRQFADQAHWIRRGAALAGRRG